ncbi:putative cytidine deaminase domain protein [Burkholderia pseudomallei]|nr:putative cytidine deaminase domain protein [Burkholderia pseudomallei]
MTWFKMASDRKDKMGSTLNPSNFAKRPRVKRYVLTYLALEDIIIKETIMPAL